MEELPAVILDYGSLSFVILLDGRSDFLDPRVDTVHSGLPDATDNTSSEHLGAYLVEDLLGLVLCRLLLRHSSRQTLPTTNQIKQGTVCFTQILAVDKADLISERQKMRAQDAIGC